MSATVHIFTVFINGRYAERPGFENIETRLERPRGSGKDSVLRNPSEGGHLG